MLKSPHSFFKLSEESGRWCPDIVAFMALHQRSSNADQKDLFPVRRVCVYGSNLPHRSASFFCRRCNSTSSSCSQCTSSSRSPCSTCQEAHEKATCTSWLQPSQQVLSPPSSLLSKASPSCKAPSPCPTSPQEAPPQRVIFNPNIKGGILPPFFLSPKTSPIVFEILQKINCVPVLPAFSIVHKDTSPYFPVSDLNETTGFSHVRIFGNKSAKIPK